jgi:hypothetical protein
MGGALWHRRVEDTHLPATLLRPSNHIRMDGWFMHDSRPVAVFLIMLHRSITRKRCF